MAASSIDATLYDIYERKAFKVHDFLVIRWCEGNLLASPYFPQSDGMFVDWITPEEVDKQMTVRIVEINTRKAGIQL